MPADFIAWSHSRLKTYRDCPRQLWHNIAPKNHADHVPYVESKAMRDGKLVDDALTRRISMNQPLPPEYAPYEGMVQVVLQQPGAKLTQAQFALDRAFKQCAYKDWDNAWLRVIYDVAVIDGKYAFLGDWKNGKVWPDEEQLRLFATVGFHIYPEVEVIDTAYIWLRHGVMTDNRYHRRELPDMWQTFLPDVERMQISFKTQQWPATPKNGARTCAYCPANAAGKCKEAKGPYKGG